jgi:hypothetical protein
MMRLEALERAVVEGGGQVLVGLTDTIDAAAG